MKISFSPGVLLLFPVLLLKGGMLFPAALLAAALHESGHLLMGRWLGIRFSRMEFDLLGALLYPTRLPSYREEFFLVIAGPLFSLLPLLFAPVLLGSAFLKYFFTAVFPLPFSICFRFAVRTAGGRFVPRSLSFSRPPPWTVSRRAPPISRCFFFFRSPGACCSDTGKIFCSVFFRRGCLRVFFSTKKGRRAPFYFRVK